MASPEFEGSTAIPGLHYRDAQAAIDWLCKVFGFEKKLVVPGPAGTIAHAELTLGRGMIMLGSVCDTPLGKLMTQPDEIGGAETQSTYLLVPDADAVYARVKATGGAVVIDIVERDFGGRVFTCRDLEGRLWTVGTHNPWA